MKANPNPNGIKAGDKVRIKGIGKEVGIVRYVYASNVLARVEWPRDVCDVWLANLEVVTE
jgi:hypothetical protein